MAKKSKNGVSTPIKSNIDLLYMTPSNLKMKDIAILFQTSTKIKTEVWEDFNILEIELPNNKIIDFEPLDIHFWDQSDVSFVKNRNINTIISIKLNEDDLSLIIPYLEQVVLQFSGFVCADTENFQPVYVGTSFKSNDSIVII